jgi:hypothetical protein
MASIGSKASPEASQHGRYAPSRCDWSSVSIGVPTPGFQREHAVAPVRLTARRHRFNRQIIAVGTDASYLHNDGPVVPAT